MLACSECECELLVKGTISAFTLCLHVNIFSGLVLSLQIYWSPCTIAQTFHRCKGGAGEDTDRLAPRRGVGLAPRPAEIYYTSQLQNHLQVLTFERQGRRAKLVCFLSLLTMKLQAYCSSCHSQLFIHPGSKSSYLILMSRDLDMHMDFFPIKLPDDH